MANIKSAMKRIKVTEKATLRNRMEKSEMKTAIRRYNDALASGDKAAADAAYTKAVKTVDQTAAHGVIHKNAANHKKAQLAKKQLKAE